MHPRQSFVNRAPWPTGDRHHNRQSCGRAFCPTTSSASVVPPRTLVTGQWRQHSKTLDRLLMRLSAMMSSPTQRCTPARSRGGKAAAPPQSRHRPAAIAARSRKSLPLLEANDIDEQNAYCRPRRRRHHIFNARSIRGKQVHQGHRLLEMLCRRGLGKRWATAHPSSDAPRDLPA